MLASQCHINLTTHSVFVKVDELDIITCFKYDQDQCDLESFTDLELASDYIFKPFDKNYYYLDLEEI